MIVNVKELYMKKMLWLALMMALLLSACQTTPPSMATQPVNTHTAAPMNTPVPRSYPLPGDAELTAAAAQEPSPYPPPGDPANATPITWRNAEYIILQGSIVHVVLYGTNELVLTDKSGSVFKTEQSSLEVVEELKERCGNVCIDMTVSIR
jgi:hypothetical protein